MAVAFAAPLSSVIHRHHQRHQHHLANSHSVRPRRSHVSLSLPSPGDSCSLDDPCITLISSATEYRDLLSSSSAATTLRFSEADRAFRASARLVVLAVTANRSLSSGLVRATARRVCAQHVHDATFLELPVDGFSGAGDIARELGVKRLPTIISFREGVRVDHIQGGEAKKDDVLDEFLLRNM